MTWLEPSFTQPFISSRCTNQTSDDALERILEQSALNLLPNMYSVFSLRRVLCKQRVLPAWRYRPLYAGSSDSVLAENIVPRAFCPYVSCLMPTIYFSDLVKMRLSSLVGLASGTSKTYRSLLLAVSSSTINKLSEYIIFKLPLSRSSRLS